MADFNSALSLAGTAWDIVQTVSPVAVAYLIAKDRGWVKSG